MKSLSPRMWGRGLGEGVPGQLRCFKMENNENTRFGEIEVPKLSRSATKQFTAIVQRALANVTAGILLVACSPSPGALPKKLVLEAHSTEHPERVAVLWRRVIDNHDPRYRRIDAIFRSGSNDWSLDFIGRVPGPYVLRSPGTVIWIYRDLIVVDNKTAIGWESYQRRIPGLLKRLRLEEAN